MRNAGGGAIVNTASLSGVAADYGHTAYNASKGAVIQFTRMLAQQYASHGIRANTVVPGLIDTPRIAHTVAKMFSDNDLDEARAAFLGFRVV
jgi:NAD(P)-dependent dehydrogenase (short-subunit alcohol dehydrogenase family)